MIVFFRFIGYAWKPYSKGEEVAEVIGIKTNATASLPVSISLNSQFFTLNSSVCVFILMQK